MNINDMDKYRPRSSENQLLEVQNLTSTLHRLRENQEKNPNPNRMDRLANSVSTHMEDVLSAIGEMYSDNAKWKERYIASKKAHFAKFFDASTTILLGTTFREWKRFAVEADAERKLTNMAHDMEDLRTAYEGRIRELETSHHEEITALRARIEDCQDELDKTHGIKTGYHEKAKHFFTILHSMKGMLEDLEHADPFNEDKHIADSMQYTAAGADQMQTPRAEVQPGHPDYIKEKLHDILATIDKKYVPPLGALYAKKPLAAKAASNVARPAPNAATPTAASNPPPMGLGNPSIGVNFGNMNKIGRI